MTTTTTETTDTMKTKGKLEMIVTLQKQLMDRMNVPCLDLETLAKSKSMAREEQLSDMYHWIQEMGIAIIHEAAEIRDWTPWKHWSKQLGNKDTKIVVGSEAHLKEIHLEVIDLLHFVIELALVTGLDAESIFKMYAAKHTINNDRQDQGDY